MRQHYEDGLSLEEYAGRWVDMEPHLATLTSLASECKSIVEFGVRGGVSTWALLRGLPADGTLISYDIDYDVPHMVPPHLLADPRWSLVFEDSAVAKLPEHADMVMIDSSHDYALTLAELRRVVAMDPRYIVLHDYYDENHPGVAKAVDEFTSTGDYAFLRVEESRWGLAILVRPSVPVLVAPIVGNFDLAAKMLDSLDAPIGRVVIVDNSLTGYVAPRKGAHHIRPILGLGYPGGINAGISQTPDAPWWMWTNADLVFGPGDIAHIASLMNGVATPRMVTGTTRALRNAYGAMNRAAVELVGLFDEWEFYPIYYDDDDMEHRCRVGGVEWVTYDGGITHAGSASLSESRFADANGRTFPENHRRYIEKWGGEPAHETYRTPYNLPVPLSYVKPDPAGRAARRW